MMSPAEPFSSPYGGSRTEVDLRPRRRDPLPAGEIEIPAPEAPPSPPNKPNLLIAIATPVASLSMALVTIVVSGGKTWYMAIPMVLMAIMVPGAQVLYYRQQLKKYQQTSQNQVAQYRVQLNECRQELEENADTQRAILQSENPPLQELIGWAFGRQGIWERQPRHDDFLSPRIGTAAGVFTVAVKPARFSPSVDEACVEMAQKLEQDYAVVPNLPFQVNLKELGSLGIFSGRRGDDALPALRHLLLNVAAHHSPQYVEIYLISHRADADKVWSWIRWLPHTGSVSSEGQSDSHIALSAGRTEAVLDNISRELAQREHQRTAHEHLLVIVDQASIVTSTTVKKLLDAGPDLGVSMIFVDYPIPEECHALLSIGAAGTFEYRETWQASAELPPVDGYIETASLDQCEQLARSLAPLRSAGSGPTEPPASVRLVTDILGYSRADQVDIGALYAEHESPDMLLDFPIGLDSDHKPVRMILRDTGSGGFGSHAMLAGMSGTGKSVTLQTIVLSLAATHSPQQVNFLLADFKAGAAELKKLQVLPHVVGYITDLNEEMAERARVALESELRRRQEIMDRAGARVTDIGSYNEQNPENPLPHLIVLLDEFARALTLNARFRATMDDVGARGRALGVHLFLSTQRATDFDEKIQANIDYRLSLRVAKREDSMTMFKRGEAALIPATRPGRGYIQYSGNEGTVFTLFQSARADTLHMPETTMFQAVEPFKVYQVESDGTRSELARYGGRKAQAATGAPPEAEVLTKLIIDYCEEAGYPPAYTILRDELPEAQELPLLGLLENQPVYQLWGNDGWWVQPGDSAQRLIVPVGMLDLPAAQKQIPWWIDFNQNDGHFWVAGAAGSGKSLFLQTLIASLTATHSPDDLNLYLMDFGQGVLRSFANLPHCNGNIFIPHERERIDRLLNFLQAEVVHRQGLLASGDEIPQSAIFVVCDNFIRFRKDYAEQLDQIATLINVGQSVDIHFVFATNSASDLPASIRDNIASRLALRLVNKDDYLTVVNHRATSSSDIFGRGLTRYRKEIVLGQVAFPALQPGDPTQQDIADWVDSLEQSWGDSGRVRQINVLETHIELEELYLEAPEVYQGMSAGTMPVGRAFHDLSPVSLDLDQFGNSTLIIGPQGSGKTELLVSLGLSVVCADAAELYILDFQRGHLRWLRDLEGSTYISGSEAPEMLENLYNDLESRAAQLRGEDQNTSGSGTLSGRQSLFTVLLIDNLTELIRSEQAVFSQVDRLAELSRDAGLRMFIAAQQSAVDQSWSMHPAIKQARQSGSGIVMSADLNVFNINLPFAVRKEFPSMPPGRGFLVARGQWEVVQFGTVLPAGAGPSIGKEEYLARVDTIMNIGHSE